MQQRKKIRSSAFGLALCGTLAGVLIWTKLRLATDVPRSAYAVPEAVEPAPADPDAEHAQADPADQAALTPHGKRPEGHADSGG